MCKEKPILFSTPMVQAILEGRKTQTRRVVKPQPATVDEFISKALVLDGSNSVKWIYKNSSELKCTPIKNSYGEKGNLLWVRESWIQDPSRKNGLPIGYCADYNDGAPFGAKKPSIHLKKEHARIWLLVENVRIERLQDISEEDALAEGIKQDGLDPSLWENYSNPTSLCVSPKQSFEKLWESINGENSWKENPWVWVVEFRRLKDFELNKIRKEVNHDR